MRIINIKNFSIVLLLITLLLTITNCGDQIEIKLSDKGSLNLNISVNDQNRTLQPDTDMQIVSYDITGTAAGDAGFALSNVTESSVSINNLEIGTWTVVVIAKNSIGTAIAGGSVMIAVNESSTASAAVLLSPLNGQGSLYLVLNWDTALTTPGITSTLTPINGTPVSINFIITGNTASYTDISLQPGYYTLSMQLTDGINPVWGSVEAVQILANESTLGNYNIITPPPAPAWITASDGSSGVRVDLAWENSLGSDQYYIYRSTSPDGIYSGIGTSTTNSFTDALVGEFINYYYKVKAYKLGGYYSSFSDYDIGYRRETRYTYTNYLSFNTADISAEITVNDLCVYDNKLFSSHWDWSHVYRYNGLVWDESAANKPAASFNPSVKDLSVYNDGTGDALYAAVNSGAFGGRGAVYKYNQGSNLWLKIIGIPNILPEGETPFGINYLCPYNGKLYVAANSGNGFPAAVYEYTSGSNWLASYESTNMVFQRMQVYNDGSGEKLYVVKYQYSPSKSEIFSFDGSSWSGPLISFDGIVDGFSVYNGKLFLSYNKSIYSYNETTWSLAQSFSYDTGAFAVWNNKLYVSVGKMIYMHEGADPGLNWNMDTDFTSVNPQAIQSLCVYNDKLYVGLRFASYRSSMTYDTSAQIYTIGLLAW